MLTFTIVTIVFLPLSFIASFLAISVQEFPHDEESGEVMWGMGAIIEYLFGISIAVSAFILLVIGFFFFRGKQKGRSTSKTPKGASDRRLKARAMSLYESDDSDSDEPSLKPKNYGGNDDGDDESGRDEEDYEREALRARYASLLSKWRWHTHIPGVRRLWLWKLYPVSRSKRHRLRSQEQWEWDYPLRRLRGIDFSLFWKNNSQPVAESYWSKHGDNDDGGDAPSSHEEENSEDEGEVAYGREIEANDGEDSECHSIDERARRETIELEHNDRVQERKNWLGSLFGQRKHGKESRHGDEVEWDEGRSQEGGRASPDAATGATPEASSFGASLAGMFRKRNKQAELDEEMGLGPGPGPGASGV
ncbi:hypothetical protein B0H63DRAFT_106260 [Podospora didyma]|uniref:Uncharacterized protein n=1 Tax=Podospora didyma TaxID=330526 RepID=A0AAE0U477_9PEZI|nr:hypothetical protein B0H63DRAFT_106260 [Podospora didyma]